MSTKLLARAAAIAVILGGVGSVAVVAANAAPSGCDFASNIVCVYADSYYTNRMGYRSSGFAFENVSAANNDKMSSWYNNGTQPACWYTHANGLGFKMDMPGYNGWYYLGIYNDSMSSWKGSACP